MAPVDLRPVPKHCKSRHIVSSGVLKYRKSRHNASLVVPKYRKSRHNLNSGVLKYCKSRHNASFGGAQVSQITAQSELRGAQTASPGGLRKGAPPAGAQKLLRRPLLCKFLMWILKPISLEKSRGSGCPACADRPLVLLHYQFINETATSQLHNASPGVPKYCKSCHNVSLEVLRCRMSRHIASLAVAQVSQITAQCEPRGAQVS